MEHKNSLFFLFFISVGTLFGSQEYVQSNHKKEIFDNETSLETISCNKSDMSGGPIIIRLQQPIAIATKEPIAGSNRRFPEDNGSGGQNGGKPIVLRLKERTVDLNNGILFTTKGLKKRSPNFLVFIRRSAIKRFLEKKVVPLSIQKMLIQTTKEGVCYFNIEMLSEIGEGLALEFIDSYRRNLPLSHFLYSAVKRSCFIYTRELSLSFVSYMIKKNILFFKYISNNKEYFVYRHLARTMYRFYFDVENYFL